MTPEKREEFIGKLEKGRALYKLSCSRCHGIFARGKDNIPNFTAAQINLYKARHTLHDSADHAFARKMAPEDLDATLYFLLYRKAR